MDTHTEPGDVLLGKYRVERVLGQGGMGIVVAARHIELGQLYAIKFLLPTMVEHDDAVERFLREARAAATLTSDHVVRVSDVGRMANGAPYMVMEYLEGCDLKALVSREGPLPIEDVVTYMLHVCDAISEAHSAGIIHRDLKPANLFLVRRRGGGACVKVLDFGISKHTGPEEIDLTNTNVSLGSPMYMSPEQMSKSKAVDGRADIWALGVILYELLTGSSPFRAASLLEVASKVLQEEPRPLRSLRPDAPEGLVEVVTRCLRKRREERFASVEELAFALQRFVSRDVAARLPMVSLMNLGQTSGTLAASNIGAHTDAGTTRLESSSPAGEPTSLTFGQTGKPRGLRKRRPLVAVGFGVAILVAGVVLWLGWRGSTTDRLAADTLSIAADASPAKDAVSATAAAMIPSASVVPDASLLPREESVRDDEPVYLSDVEATEANSVKPVPGPVKPKVTTVNVVKVVNAPSSTPVQAPAPSPSPTTTRPDSPF
jgi:serine/threonine-protein kinase